MKSREDVIKGLECCQLDVNKCLDCPYLDNQNEVAECGVELHRDAIALLKAQEQSQRDYESATEMTQYCERYEPTYNTEDGSL